MKPRWILACALGMLAVAGQAQINISGNVFNGSGGPLVPGSVYVVQGSVLTVPAGQTLTVQAGVIVKFQQGQRLDVHGTLSVLGTGANPVHFTDYRDDSAGGDTNGNGPSSGAPDWWQGLTFSATAGASVLTQARIRFVGYGYTPCASISDSNPGFQSCSFLDSNHGGLQLNNSGARPSVVACTFVSIGGNAIRGVTIDAVPGFLNNAASNCGGNFIEVVSPTMTADRTIIAANCMNGALVFVSNHVAIPAGRNLTIGAGVVCKFMQGLRVIVNGSTLIVNGTAQTPVVFTDWRDDAYGGDTNNDGPSAGAGDWWQGIQFAAGSGASTLTNAIIRYTGYGYTPCVDINAASPTLTGCTLERGNHGAMSLGNTAAFPAVSGCSILNCGGAAVRSVPLDAVPGFVNNTATGNGGNYIEVVSPTMTANRTITAANCMGGALFINPNHLAIPAGRTLTLGPGVVLKLNQSIAVIVNNATLVANGTAANPVVFTDVRDDVYGGDTNNNGPSTGAGDWWQGISFQPGSGASILGNAIVRYTGYGYTPCVSINAANPVLERCTFAFGNHGGINLNNSAALPLVAACTFQGIGGVAVRSVPLDAVPGFLDNTSTGSGGNYIEIVSTNLVADRTITATSCMGGALVMNNHLVIPAGRRLRLEPGVVVKFNQGLRCIIDGALDVAGIGLDPVVFTDIRDDQYGGDTNNDGSSTGAGDWWQGLVFNASGAASLAEHLLVRFTGWGYTPAIACDSPLASLVSTRADFGNWGGIVASAHAGFGDNWVAFRCNSYGIRLSGPSAPSLRHPTVTGGNNAGVEAHNGFPGTVQNGIAWANATNFVGFTATSLQNCDGLSAASGSNGNIHLDPLFADPSPAVGNLRLLLGSPCVGTGAMTPAVAVAKDHEENSRILDATLSGSMLPDMGAFELAAYSMGVTGVPRIGSTLTFTVNGPAGQSIVGIGALDAPPLLAPPYGLLTIGNLATILILPIAIPTSTPLPIQLPLEPTLVGIVIGLQTLTVPNANPNVGNLTNVYRAHFRF